jgi:two-component system, OmpR family, response regulator VanR
MKRKKSNILIIEDNDSDRENIMLYLQSKGFHVEQASDGIQAYGLIQKNDFDLIISDIQMPKLDGLTLIERVRCNNPEIAVIIISAYSENKNLLRAIPLNLTSYLIKPFSRTELLTAVNKALMHKEKTTIVELGQNYSYDIPTQTLYYKDTTILLNKQQALAFEVLALNKNKIIKGEDIYYHIYDNYTVEYNAVTLRTIIKRLREQLPTQIIETVYGIGYILKCSEC